MILSEDLQELKNRKYSIYDSKAEEYSALEELHARDYQILDEEGTSLLKSEYEEEFEKTIKKYSLTSLQEEAKQGDVLQILKQPKAIDRKETSEIVLPKWLIRRKEVKEKKATALKEIISTLLLIKQKQSEESDAHYAIQKNKYEGLVDSLQSHAKEIVENYTLEQILNFDILFYIKETNGRNDICNAYGKYNKKDKTFTLLAGSMIVSESSLTYDFSPQGIERRDFINKHCRKSKNGWILKTKHTFKSATKASSFVLGKVTSGNHRWKDANGLSLKQYIDTINDYV